MRKCRLFFFPDEGILIGFQADDLERRIHSLEKEKEGLLATLETSKKEKLQLSGILQLGQAKAPLG